MNVRKILSYGKSFLRRQPFCRILLYHRIADIQEDPFLLSVSQKNFMDQVRWLKRNTEVVSLLELLCQLENGGIKKNCVCLTFDDGYADNFYKALPILKQFKAPATIFVTSGMVNKKEPFYWDENIRKEDQGRALRSAELFELAKESLIEIGSHTITHPYLPRLNLEDQKKEIFQSRVILEKILHKKISGFSYPFGTMRDYNKQTIKLVKNAGYNYACSNIQGVVDNKSSLYALPRCLVRDWSREEFKVKFQNF